MLHLPLGLNYSLESPFFTSEQIRYSFCLLSTCFYGNQILVPSKLPGFSTAWLRLQTGLRTAIKPTRGRGARVRLAPVPGEARWRGIRLVGAMLSLSDLLKADNQMIFLLKWGSRPCPKEKRRCFGLCCAQRESWCAWDGELGRLPRGIVRDAATSPGLDPGGDEWGSSGACLGVPVQVQL